MGKTGFQYGRQTVADKINLKKHFLDSKISYGLAKNRHDTSIT